MFTDLVELADQSISDLVELADQSVSGSGNAVHAF